MAPIDSKEIQKGLQSKTLGRWISYFKTTTSTNDEAVRRAQEGGQEGEIFIADIQTAGRGRLHRVWESPKGKNLALSFLLRPSLSPASATLLTLAAGAAVFEAVWGFLPEPIRSTLKIKWPNDVTLEGKKIAGILTEMASEGGRVDWVVVGIGIDVNAEPSDFSPEVRQIATSLRTVTGTEYNRNLVASRLIDSFEHHYRTLNEKGPEDLIRFCEKHSYLKGRRVSAEENGKQVIGTVLGLDPRGSLQVKTDDGTICNIIVGDVNPLERS